jgi:hypothetical protein
MLNSLLPAFAACPANWNAHGNKCFFLSRDNETFSDALVDIPCFLVIVYDLMIVPKRVE